MLALDGFGGDRGHLHEPDGEDLEAEVTSPGGRGRLDDAEAGAEVVEGSCSWDCS